MAGRQRACRTAYHVRPHVCDVGDVGEKGDHDDGPSTSTPRLARHEWWEGGCWLYIVRPVGPHCRDRSGSPVPGAACVQVESCGQRSVLYRAVYAERGTVPHDAPGRTESPWWVRGSTVESSSVIPSMVGLYRTRVPMTDCDWRSGLMVLIWTDSATAERPRLTHRLYASDNLVPATAPFN